MIEVECKNKELRVFMKRLYDILVHSEFHKVNVEYHLERGDYCEHHKKEGHYIEDYIEFR
jgi:hypothetical protein